MAQSLRNGFVMFAALTSAGLAACGGDDGSGGPDATTVVNPVLKAYRETGDQVFEERPLNTSCLGTPTADMASTVEITLNTKVTDFQEEDGVPGATVGVFDGFDYMNPVATGTASSAAGMEGDISLVIPAGRRRFGFRMQAEDWFDTLLLFQYLDPAMATQTSPATISPVSQTTGLALPALVGVTRSPGTGILAGAIRDCDKNEIAGFTATVSSVSGQKMPIAGARTFYFGPNGLPARNNVEPIGSENGLFAVLELPPTPTAFIQTWGYLNQADADAGRETLLSELQVPVVADLVITGSYELQRTGN
ncbi:MAG: hypothetical protein KBG28_26460 [Kofleriaceae bacterium]|jgi:hypothetical protein|nr:hypothetical protein [Kofleriaceae bacterium]MBP6836516.1 hypothetical protein [Kofleriaceae bacterium]MBP9207536.1 hypothetical protein [Kofleriaceae bacterium]